jgi:hypothetical protein
MPPKLLITPKYVFPKSTNAISTKTKNCRKQLAHKGLELSGGAFLGDTSSLIEFGAQY